MASPRFVIAVCLLLLPLLTAADTIPPSLPAKQTELHPDDYWLHDFNDKGAVFTLEVEPTKTLPTMITSEVVTEETAGGKRCAKVEFVCKNHGYLFLRVPLATGIAVADGGYVSCRVKNESVSAHFAGIYVKGERCGSVETLPDGWLHIASDKVEGVIDSMVIRFNPVHRGGGRVLIYLDDLRVSRSQTPLAPKPEEFHRLLARWEQMHRILPELLLQLTDPALKAGLEKNARKLQHLQELNVQSLSGLSQGKFSGALKEFESRFWYVKWQFFFEQANR